MLVLGSFRNRWWRQLQCAGRVLGWVSSLLFKRRKMALPLLRSPASLAFLSFHSSFRRRRFTLMAEVGGGAEGTETAIPKLLQSDGTPLHQHREEGKESRPFLKVKKLSSNAVLPTRGSSLAAGYDLSSAISTVVPARGKALVPTDLSIAVAEGTYARIAPRSGLAWKHSIDVGAGVIDADYRGPVGVILFNYSDSDFLVNAGDRIAQLIIEKIASSEVLEVEDLDSTIRGVGGFGSTGK